MKKCPECGAMSFIVTAHVAEDWLVDENGNYIRTIDCIETVHHPDDSDIWECANCGYAEEGAAFNV